MQALAPGPIGDEPAGPGAPAGHPWARIANDLHNASVADLWRSMLATLATDREKENLAGASL
jgi:hypothetical protein